LKSSISTGLALNLPPAGGSTMVSGNCTPVYCALSPSVGLRSASTSPACACARRARASAACRSGLPARASSTSASSCGSPKACHHARSGKLALASPCRLRCAASVSASSGVPCGARPWVLAQPASSKAMAIAAATTGSGACCARCRRRRGIESFMGSGAWSGGEVVAHAFEQAGEQLALDLVHAFHRALAHALAAGVDVLPDRQSVGGQFDIECTPVAGNGLAFDQAARLQLVQQPRHCPGIDVRSAGQIGDAGNAAGGELLQGDVLAEGEVVPERFQLDR